MARRTRTLRIAVVKKGHRLRPEQLGLLAKHLANAGGWPEAARLRERLARGFYGI